MTTKPKADPRKITYLPLAGLTPDPRNPKDHDLSAIDSSIGRFGMLDPIVRDERTGFMVSGHGRHTTLSEMERRGENPPEGVKVAEDGSWLVPVVTGWASRTDSEASAALIALNRTTELGDWVDDALLGLLDELDSIENGLDGVGFSDREIDRLRTVLAAQEHEERGGDPSEFGGSEPNNSNPVVSYLMVFDTEEEKVEFTGYLRTLRRESEDPDATLVGLLLAHLGRTL